MTRILVILAVVFALAMPASAAFASGKMMLDCKCPMSKPCADQCDMAKCGSVAPSSFVPPAPFSHGLVMKADPLVAATAFFTASSLTSSLFKPPRQI